MFEALALGAAIATCSPSQTDVSNSGRSITLSTNTTELVATIMNIGTELNFNSRYSLFLPVSWCPWFISSTEAIRVIALRPEMRWWFGKYGKGHYTGIHLNVGWYNVRHKSIRYQDISRPAMGAGISYGYALPLRGNWALSFSAGFGIVSFEYERFRNSGNGTLLDRKRTLYWGPDNLGITIGYNFEL